jgi:hypothetical protein
LCYFVWQHCFWLEKLEELRFQESFLLSCIARKMTPHVWPHPGLPVLSEVEEPALSEAERGNCLNRKIPPNPTNDPQRSLNSTQPRRIEINPAEIHFAF